MTQSQAEQVKREFIGRGLTRVIPHSLYIRHPQLGVDYAPRAMGFDGATGVRDLALEYEGRHDYLYIVGQIAGHPVTKLWCDQYLGRGYRASGHPWVAVRRVAGLTWFPVTSWISWRIWRNRRSHDGVAELAKQMLPEPDKWRFEDAHGLESWLMRDAAYTGGVE